MKKNAGSSGSQTASALTDDADTLTWADVRRFFARHGLLVAGVTVLALIASVAFLLLTPPKYYAEVLLAPVQDEQANDMSAIVNQFGGLASLAGVNLGDTDAAIEEAMAVLQSRRFTADFIQAENLLPVLFADDWDSAAGRWTVDDPDDVPTLLDGIELFDEQIRSLHRDRRTGLVTLGIQWTDAELAAKWAGILVQRLNEFEKQQAILNAENTIAYLTERLDETGILEMRSMIFRLLEVQTKKVILAKTRDEFVFRTIDPAVVPEEPIWPRKLPTLMIGLVGGFGFGIVLVFALRALRGGEAAA